MVSKELFTKTFLPDSHGGFMPCTGLLLLVCVGNFIAVIV